MQVLIFLRSAIRRIFMLPILIYQHLISPALPGACIYNPTCSHYSKQAILTHGVFKGFLLGITRIFRCAGGLFTGGDDPVPEKFSFHYISDSYAHFWARGKKSEAAEKDSTTG